MSDDCKNAAFQMPWIGPSIQFQLFGLFRILSVCRRRVRIAAVGADQPVDHRLERRRRLIPVTWGHNHDAMRPYPKRIYLVHPVIRLAEAMVWVA